MALKIGNKAPLFSTEDQDGNPVELKSYRGKKVALVFYPGDNTPTCTKEVCNLRDQFDELLKAGFVILTISPDSAKKHQNFIKKYDLPFPILMDTDLEIIKKYDVWGPKKVFGREIVGLYRTTFIIDEDGNIERIIDKVKATNHADQILENN